MLHSHKYNLKCSFIYMRKINCIRFTFVQHWFWNGNIFNCQNTDKYVWYKRLKMAQIKSKFMTLALYYFKILFITITIMLKFYKNGLMNPIMDILLHLWNKKKLQSFVSDAVFTKLCHNLNFQIKLSTSLNRAQVVHRYTYSYNQCNKLYLL